MSISIFPNPTSSVLNIQYDKEIKLTLFNMLGQEIMQTNEKEIDMSGIEQGTYILVIQNLETNNFTNFKIIKE